MRSLTVVVSLAFLLLLPIVVNASERVHWDYDVEGPFGPQNWSNLSVDFGLCQDGSSQSPVNLTGAYETRLAPIELHWEATDWELRNTGYTIAAYPKDGGYVIIEDERFELVQFNLHNPSEHHIEGRSFPMEAHFVHRDKGGSLAVISVMIDGGGVNPLFDAFMAKAPIKENAKVTLKAFDPTPITTDLGDILRYQGSLTVPPCTENVMWTVLTDPLVVSDAALLAFNTLFNNNARPVQPLNRRFVLTD